MINLEDKRIFLTGGTGFFGKSLLTWLLIRNLAPELWILSREPQQFFSDNPWFYLPNCYFIGGDLASPQFPAGVFDYVIHAATPPQDDPDFRERTIEYTKKVIGFCQHSGAKMLYLSSVEVEADKLSEYAQTKLEAEKLISESGIDFVIARCGEYIGPFIDYSERNIVGNLLNQAIKQEPVTPIANRHHALLDTEEWVEWCLTILTQGGGIYNVCSETSITTIELANTISQVAKIDAAISLDSLPMAENLTKISSASRVREEFGLTPQISLAESIERIFKLNSFISNTGE